MYVAPTHYRCAAATGTVAAGSTASTRCTAEAPTHWCPTGVAAAAAGLSKTIDNQSPPPYFVANLGHPSVTVKVEVRSGCGINMISESLADALGLEIVIDEYGYEDYVSGDEYECGDDDKPHCMKEMSGSSMDDVVGLTAFTLHRNGCELWFDGMVMKDESLNDDLLVAGAPFMEANDISVRPSRHMITFGDSSVFRYGRVADVCPSYACEPENVVVHADQPAVHDSVGEFEEELELDTRPVSSVSECCFTDCADSGARCSGSHGDQVSGHTPVADRLPSANGQESGVQLPLVITQAHEHQPSRDVSDLPLPSYAASCACACDDSHDQTPTDTEVPEESDDNRPTLALHAYLQTVHGRFLPPVPDVRHPHVMGDSFRSQCAVLPPGVREHPPSDGCPANPLIPFECTGGAFPTCPSLDTGGIPPDPENPVAPTLTQDSPSGPSVDGSTVLLGTNGSSVLAPVHDGPPGCSMNGNRSSYGADVSGPVPQSNVLDAACLHVFPVDMVKDSKYRQEDNGPLNPHGSVSQHPIGGATSFSLVLDDSRAPLQSPAYADDPRTVLPVSDVSIVPHLLTSPDVPPPPTPPDVPGPPPASSTDVLGPPPTASTDVPGSPPTSAYGVQPIPSLMGTASPSCHDPDVPQRRPPYHGAGRGCGAPLLIDDAPWSPFLQYGCEDNRPPDDTCDSPSVTRMMPDVRYSLHVATTLWMYLLLPSSGRISSPPYFLKPPPPPTSQYRHIM